jgi:hypothetical protein
MAVSTAVVSINGLVYVSGSDLVGANAASISINTRTVEYITFGDTWVNNAAEISEWSGSLGAVHDQDAQLLQTQVTARTSVTLLIYPNRSDLTTYYNGSAIFTGFSHEAALGAAVMQTAEFIGTGTLTITGFS